ncbi:4-hydroxyacetophenone monooxygenase [Apiospora arundinis]|uniref:Sin-like protein conserved region-domain-containing protein n=1 Tax=Apiospora arundinis TaxID=335852 RepID=A0ABR2IV61_9PEZI
MDIDDDTPPVEVEPTGAAITDAAAATTTTTANANTKEEPPFDPNDPDPIVASYNVYMNPPPESTRKLLILQHPNKQGPLREAYSSLHEVRVKPVQGMIEVDVALDYSAASYDKDKGMRWGQTLTRSMGAKSGGSHGLAGGFGVGVPAPRGGRRREEDRDIYDWGEAVRRDQVLRTQTLGGMITDGDGRNAKNDCRWLVGVFKGDNLHLTPATSEIQLRPQLHHLDADTEQKQLAQARERANAGLAKEAAAAAAANPSAPKAIQMTMKSASGEETTTETMTDRLRHVQMEGWQKLKYVGEEEDAAWELYNKTLHYAPALEAEDEEEKATDTKKDGDSKEAGSNKGKGKATESAAIEAAQQKLKLGVKWGEEDFLHAVAGKDRVGVLEGYGSTVLPGIKAEDEALVVKKEEDTEGGVRKVPAARGAAGAAAAGAAARGRGKAPAATPAATAAKRGAKK